jgi:hypothetical protein
MKNIILILCFLPLVSCTAKDLTPKERELVAKLNFDLELMIVLKNETATELIQLPNVDQETGEIGNGLFEGIHSKIIIDDNYTVVKKLKDQFKQKGYLIFVFNDNYDHYSIAVIKGSDELDIIRYRRTDGINYDLENKNVIEKLIKWKSKNDFNILGCGRDWLQFEFKNLPTDLNKFSKEAYEFCPDIVDQGVGDLKSLKEAIIEMNGLYLWWD